MVWFTHNIRVRYAETDQMGVVYHGNYLDWFEVGRTEMLRTTGVTYRSLEEKGLLLPVSEAHIKFHAPGRYDDEVEIRVLLTEAKVRLIFQYEIIRTSDRTKLVSGSTIHAWVNTDMRPISLRKVDSELYQLILSQVSEAKAEV